jgi:hypothetical protein
MNGDSSDEIALRVRHLLLNDDELSPLDLIGRVPPQPVFKPKRDFAIVRQPAETRRALRDADSRRRRARGGPTNGSDASLVPRAVASPDCVRAPVAMMPWETRSRPPFTLPSITQLKAQQRGHSLTPEPVIPSRRSDATVTSGSGVNASTMQRLSGPTGMLNHTQVTATGPRRKLLVTPRTYEYLRTTPTPESIDEVVEAVSRIVESNHRHTWERMYPPAHHKSAKRVAAERKAKIHVLLSAISRGGPPPTDPETNAVMQEAFAMLATGETVAADAVHAHLTRSDMTPCRNFAGVRRGLLTYDQLVRAVFDHPSYVQ